MKFTNNISDKAWDDFVKKSHQNNIFCKTRFLKNLKIDYDKVALIDNNNELILGSIIFDKNFNFSKIATLYNGIILSSKIDKPYKIIEVLNYYLNEYFKFYEKLELRSHYNFNDIRPFSWYNHKNEKKFKIEIKYTGLLKLKDINLNKTINSGRLQSIKKALKKGYTSSIEKDIEILDFLNKKTFAKQNLIRGKRMDFFTKIISGESIKNSYGRLVVTRNKNSEPVSASLFLYNDKIEYYLVGGTSEEALKDGGASLNIYDQIIYAINQKSDLIDFVGINSPHIGYFKTSFGCSSKPYFELSYK
tara:strand:- start:9406 stop:10317 length:912 start_codon:yes stop_codon:yes gene_type:complete